MRADLGGFVADGALAGAGLAVLWALGLVDRGARSMFPALGLAYLVGSAVVGTVLILLLVLGIPFRLVTFAVVVVLCLAIGVAIGLRRASRASDEAERLSFGRPLSADAWLVIGFAVLLAAYALWGVFAAREIPMDGWDDWSIWSRKAEILTSHGSLIEGFFSAPPYVFMHQDYPLLYPVWEAIHYRAAGAIDTQAIHAHIWLLLIAFVWAAAYLVRDVVRPVVWAPLLLAIAAAPGVWSHLLSAYADVPVAGRVPTAGGN